jgi:hypothetical protein
MVLGLEGNSLLNSLEDEDFKSGGHQGTRWLG